MIKNGREGIGRRARRAPSLSHSLADVVATPLRPHHHAALGYRLLQHHIQPTDQVASGVHAYLAQLKVNSNLPQLVLRRPVTAALRQKPATVRPGPAPLPTFAPHSTTAPAP